MDFYLILGVEPEASLREVKRAYTRLARRYHPDINPGDREAEAFYRQATEAYETLADPDRRAEYDTHGPRVPTSMRSSVEFHGFDFSSPATDASATFGDLFSEAIRHGGPESGSHEERAGDLFGDVSLGFDEALRGSERRLTVTRLDVCAACGGSGVRRASETRCAECQGRGARQWRRGHMVFSKSCEACHGTGRQRKQACIACRSEGVVARSEDIIVQVPAGVADGARMRVPTKGNAGRRGGAVGDLYITAKVAGHRLFVRDGDDLLLGVPVTITEAALGATIEVPTLEGPVRVRVPPNTGSGQRLRISGRGAPSPRTGERGDLIVTVTLSLPRAEDERSRELLRELGRLEGADVRRHLFVE